MSTFNFRHVDAIFDDLKKLLNIEKDVDLAAALNISTGKLGVWRTRNFVPVELLLTICRDKGFDVFGLFYGDPPSVVNLSLMRDIIAKVEEVFQEQDLHLPPKQKAELITLLYEEILEDESRRADIGGRVVRLMKIAL